MDYLIVVAGGKGIRFGSDLPKQFLNLLGKPVLMHSISAFFNYDNDIKIILALPKSHFAFWKNLCIEYDFNIPHLVVEGGEMRFHSVKNALSKVEGRGVVGIHDGVRPLIDRKSIDNCYSTAKSKGNAIPVIDLVDSIRKVRKSNGKHKVLNRLNYKLVQTPQVFDIQHIKRAFTQNFKDAFTDDASVLEHYDGSYINMVEGNRQNLKITRQEDLVYAEAILKFRMQNAQESL